MKILFVLHTEEYLRYYVATIRLLAAHGHTVLLALSNGNSTGDVKKARLEHVADPASRILDAGRVPERRDRFAAFASGLRGTMDYLRFLHPDYRCESGLRERMKRRGLPRWLHFIDRVGHLNPALLRCILACLAVVERLVPGSAPITGFIAGHAPDIVLVTPLVTVASAQVEVLKSAQALGLATAVCVASWDNLTNKGLLRVRPDRLFVWNETQRLEASRYHGVRKDTVVITGAPVFDPWFDAAPSRDRARFCERVGLSPDRPLVLFVGSSSFISEHEEELGFVRRWVNGIRRSANPALREAGLLIRPHPYACHLWADVDLSALPGVAVWPRDTPDYLNRGDQCDFFDSLYHSAAVVGINTSAMIEAAIVDRPVHTLVTDRFRDGQGLTIHFNYLLPEHGGFVQSADNLEQHCSQLAESLADGSRYREMRRRFCQRFVRPLGIDRPCAPVLAHAIEEMGRREPAAAMTGGLAS